MGLYESLHLLNNYAVFVAASPLLSDLRHLPVVPKHPSRDLPQCTPTALLFSSLYCVAKSQYPPGTEPSALETRPKDCFSKPRVNLTALK